MKILYASTLCSENEFEYLYSSSKVKLSQQMQKYNLLLAKGFAEIEGTYITALSAKPITKHTHKILFSKKKMEEEMGISYKYLPFINLPIIKSLCIIIGSFINTIKWILKEKKSNIALLCDVLNVSVSIGALLAGKLFKKPVVGIVTDVPGYFSTDEEDISLKRRIMIRLMIKIINKYDCYILLTKYMNDVINKSNKPYCIIEGQVDIDMSKYKNDIKSKYQNKVCMYAGTVNTTNGIDILVKAFSKAQLVDTELHIYGEGDYYSELLQFQRNCPGIKVFGAVINNIVVEEEGKVDLLINPRPTNRNFVKYSFPSKNMEYMVSGTPVLTTKLPGMPEEYNEHVYFIEDETVEGLTKTLKQILTKSKEELHKKGVKAKGFVLREKNNVVQATTVLNMIKLKTNQK